MVQHLSSDLAGGAHLLFGALQPYISQLLSDRFKSQGKCRVMTECKPQSKVSCNVLLPCARLGDWLWYHSIFHSDFSLLPPVLKGKSHEPLSASFTLLYWAFEGTGSPAWCVCRWLLFLYAILLYIYICRYTCFGWFACFLTASDFHTKCMIVYYWSA